MTRYIGNWKEFQEVLEEARAGCSSVEDVMHKFKEGTLKTKSKRGKGGKKQVRKRKQAIAIALDKKRREGWEE